MQPVERKYYLLSIDSMHDGMGWYWNSACREHAIHISDDVFDSNRKLLKMMREMGILSEDSKGKVVVDRYDGSSVEFQCRNYMPVYALQLEDTEYCSSCEDEQDAERMEYIFLTEDESLGGWYCRICIDNGLVEVQGY